MKEFLKRNFWAGILVLVPISLTFYIIVIIFRAVDRILAYLPAKYNPQTYLPFPIPGLGLIFAFLIIMLVGFIARNILAAKLLDFGKDWLTKFLLFGAYM